MKKFLIPIILTVILLIISPISIKKSIAIKSTDDIVCDRISEMVSNEIDEDILRFKTLLNAERKKHNEQYNAHLGMWDFDIKTKTVSTKRASSYYAVSATVVINENSLVNVDTDNLKRGFSPNNYDSNLVENIQYNKEDAPICPNITYIVASNYGDVILYDNYYPDAPYNVAPRYMIIIYIVLAFAFITIISWVISIFLHKKYKNVDAKYNRFYKTLRKNYITLSNFNDRIPQVEKIAKKSGLKLSPSELLIIYKNENKKYIYKKLGAKFYDACAKVGISYVVSSKSDVERIAIIARKMGIDASNNDICEIYNLARQDKINRESQLRIQQIEKERQKALEQKKENEAKFEALNQKYKNLVGTSKAKAALADEIARVNLTKLKCEAEINKIKSNYNMAYHSGKQHVPDWAIHGGIASGIAGGAAGAMVAMDVKQRADKAKSQNAIYGAALLLSETEKTSPLYEKIDSINKELELLNNKYTKIDMLLVENLSESLLLSRIKPQCNNIRISETGNIILDISTYGHSLVIFDDTRAVVDGTIEVLLMNADKQVGTAYFSLPYTGSADNYNTNVYCTNISEKVTNVEFRPYHLWAIEKI